MKGQTKQSFLTNCKKKKTHTIEVQRMNEERKWERKKYKRNVVHRRHAKVVKITRSNLYKMELFRFSFSLLLIMAHDNRSYAWFLSNTFYTYFFMLTTDGHELNMNCEIYFKVFIHNVLFVISLFPRFRTQAEP